METPKSSTSANVDSAKAVSDTMSKSEQVTARLKLLANANRLRIVCHLLKGEAAVGDIERDLDIRQPTLSREISKLRESGVLTARRQSKVVFYALTDTDMTSLVKAVCVASSSTSEDANCA